MSKVTQADRNVSVDMLRRVQSEGWGIGCCIMSETDGDELAALIVDDIAEYRLATEAPLRAEIAALQQALVNHNDVLRSAYQIAARKGDQTEWEGFTLRAGSVLHFHHDEVSATRAAVSQEADRGE